MTHQECMEKLAQANALIFEVENEMSHHSPRRVQGYRVRIHLNEWRNELTKDHKFLENSRYV